MSNESTLSLFEIDGRIAILRDNIRQLTEQAAALSGAGDEARTADRIADQQAELDRLVALRDEMMAKRAATSPPAAAKASVESKTTANKLAGKTVAPKKKAAAKKAPVKKAAKKAPAKKTPAKKKAKKTAGKAASRTRTGKKSKTNRKKR
jgi:hypothetical protein